MIFAKIPCGLLLASLCYYDPATYQQPRTIAGCHELVRLMVAETNGYRPRPGYTCVDIRTEK